ncbi:hypothetical protein TSUD_173830 [Trifolium subterraneum]|nr:hypothetical protein TSUD_173830 [Trifolium subterraneum]
MSYLYGKRFVAPITPLILQLIEELYTDEPYEKVNWTKARHLCAKEDLYYPHPLIQDLIWDSLYIFTEPFLTRWPFNKLVREKALQVTMKHIHYEDENSRYITMGAVEKSFGSQEWDAGFAVQALLATNLIEEIGPALAKGHDFIKKSQCCLLLSMLPPEIVGEKMEPKRVKMVVSQHGSQREVLNPTEFFADIVVEYEYVECTGAAIQALVMFQKLYPEHRKKEIENFIPNAVRFLEEIQNVDGSWYGSWAICFVYGSWFALGGLAAAGKTYTNCAAICKAIYVPLEGSQSNVVQTAWALMGLIHAGQEITGSFFKNGLLHYAMYRNIFPLWALAEYRRRVPLPSTCLT